MEMLSFVILTWNSGKTIENCLERIDTICRGQGIDFEIFVVDNGSSDSTVDIISSSAAHMPIELIRLQKNMGTTRTRNMALKKCRGDMVCVMDSDAALLEGDLTSLLAMLRSDPTIGILAPKLLYSDGTVQNSVRRFPSMLGKFRKIPSIVLKHPVPEDDLYEGFPFESVTRVDYAISACWFFRRELLDAIGYLDEHIFYSPEDVDFCIRARKAGREVVYYPFVTVLHHVQRITRRYYCSRIAASHLMGLIYYFLKHRYVGRPDIPDLRSPGNG
jgi:GT2 family glycosyltransferase